MNHRRRELIIKCISAADYLQICGSIRACVCSLKCMSECLTFAAAADASTLGRCQAARTIMAAVGSHWGVLEAQHGLLDAVVEMSPEARQGVPVMVSLDGERVAASTFKRRLEPSSEMSIHHSSDGEETRAVRLCLCYL